MPGAILQLVVNTGASQNLWLDHQPEITFFKKLYRRHTPFTTELIKIPFKQHLDFGKKGSIDIPYLGDLVHRIFFCFDIPELAAEFLNLKSQDIYQVIDKFKINDNNLLDQLKSCLGQNSEVEIDRIINLLEYFDTKYHKDLNNQMNILDQLKSYKDNINIESFGQNNRLQSFSILESEYYPQIEINSCDRINNRIRFNINLADIWMNEHKEFVPIYELIKLIYFSEETMLDKIPVINSQKAMDNLIENILPNQSIHQNKFSKYFGSEFYQTLNSYNLMSNILKSLAKTVPIILIKPYQLDNLLFNIYQNDNNSNLSSKYYPCVVDPVFKTKFIQQFSRTEKIIEDNSFAPLDLFNIFDQINLSENNYLRFIQDNVTLSLNNIQNKMDLLFQLYQGQLFQNTSNLFYQNKNFSNIYCYTIPTQPYQDQSDLRIPNVFNINIWFFYFFKYLDTLEQNDFVHYVQINLMPEITDNGKLFLKNLIFLLKINIEFYMNEISYLLNDLYATTPSTYSEDNMKNYVPVSHTSNQKLLAITIIFHRNHVPSITEMFQFIYDFISNISIEKINQYLDINISEITSEMLSRIRQLTKLLYYQIYQYFINAYDQCHFEEPAQFSTSDYSTIDNNKIENYVTHFLNNSIIAKNKSQMEFYFITEMINTREIQKLYHKLLMDGHPDVNTELMSMISETFNQIDLDQFRIEKDGVRKYLEQRKSDIDYQTSNLDRYCGESYLNTLYQPRHYNLSSDHLPLLNPVPLPPSDPYGVPTNYYDHNQTINQFIPLFLSNDQMIDEEIPISWVVKNNTNIHNQQSILINQSNNNKTFEHQFQLFPVDFFGINHRVFFNNRLIVSNTQQSIQPYQFSLLNTYHLILDIPNHLILDIPNQSDFNCHLLPTLETNIYFLMKYTHPDLVCPSLNQTCISIMHNMLDTVENNLEQESLIFSDTLINNMIMVIQFLLNLENDQKEYTSFNLINNNQYTLEVKKSNQYNILDRVRILRDNFLSQYFYYVKHALSIQKLSNLNNLSFKSVDHLLSKVISSLNPQHNIQINLSNLSYLYPSSNTTIIPELLADVDDFNGFIIRSLIGYDGNNFRLSEKDVLDIINISFISIKQIYDYLIKHDQLDDVLKLLEPIQSLLISKMKLLYQIDHYLEIIDGTHYLTAEKIQQVILLAKQYDIDNEQYLMEISDQYHDPLVIHKRIHSDIDQFFLKKLSKDLTETTFKEYIISILPKQISHHLHHLDNEYYSYIYFFLSYAKNNSLDPQIIQNPLLNYREQNEKLNQSFQKLSDILEYYLNYVWNAVISSGDKIKQVLHQEPLHQTDIITHLLEKQKTYDALEELLNKGMILSRERINDLNSTKKKIENIMYRNKKSKSAWVRKLAHFLVQEIKFSFRDQDGNISTSDWLQVFEQISLDIGLETGYHKMIGHREDLIIFNDQVKKSYTIALPLIFYFNRNIALALPLNASTNTRYQIHVSLRSLEDVTYREEFSSFINPRINISSYQPQLSNVHLMVEYIYLSLEERQIFSTKPLEYFIDEVQYSETSINDNNLIPMFQTENDTNLKDLHELSTGIVSSTLKESLSNVHQKKIELINRFDHPSKMMVILIKPTIHTNPSIRHDYHSYFHGEKQWDNYGLNSYYQLDLINKTKTNHYHLMHHRLNDIDDYQLGLITIINQLLLDYTTNQKLETNILETWIQDNLTDYLSFLQTIKDNFIHSDQSLTNQSNNVKLREDILFLRINFPIMTQDMLIQIINDIYLNLEDFNCDLNIHNTKIGLEGISKTDLFNLIENSINKGNKRNVHKNHLERIIERVYDNYNETIVNIIINKINNIWNINSDIYHFQTIVYYSYHLYLTHELANPIIKKLFNLIYQNVILKSNHSNNRDIIRYLNYKDIIYQILNDCQSDNILDCYLLHTPYVLIEVIAQKMNQKMNQLFNKLSINLINYHDYLIENPKVSPLISGHLKFNDVPIMPEKSISTVWTDVNSYQYLDRTPDVGINLYSWSLKPLSDQIQGSANLSRIDHFSSVYYIDPKIGNGYPAVIVTMILSINIVRYLTGLCGKAW